MSVDGEFYCYTMEPRQDQSEGKPFCIPAGSYGVDLLPSAHFQMITPHVRNVPGFTEIEIHPGNYPKDTEGCTLVGEDRGADQVYRSKPAFDRLMTLLRATHDKISITYKEIE